MKRQEQVAGGAMGEEGRRSEELNLAECREGLRMDWRVGFERINRRGEKARGRKY